MGSVEMSPCRPSVVSPQRRFDMRARRTRYAGRRGIGFLKFSGLLRKVLRACRGAKAQSSFHLLRVYLMEKEGGSLPIRKMVLVYDQL